MKHIFGDSLVVPKTSGVGVMVDHTAPTWGYKDLIGQIEARDTGATAPAWAVWNGGIKQYQFSVNDESVIVYHWPHDAVPPSAAGFVAPTIHPHWSHNAATVTGGSVTWGFEMSFAKGFDQAAFGATKTTTGVSNASTTALQHIITEFDICVNGGSPTLLDCSLLEPDGLLIVRVYLSANNITVSGGGVPDPFLHTVDLHYMTTGILGTKSKTGPSFYT